MKATIVGTELLTAERPGSSEVGSWESSQQDCCRPEVAGCGYGLRGLGVHEPGEAGRK